MDANRTAQPSGTFGSVRRRTNPWIFSANVGFFAGLIWGLLKIVFYWFEFTKVKPAFFVKPWYLDSYLNGWQGHVVGLFWIIMASIGAALLYALLFRKVKGPWMGVVYGLAWWALLYILIGPWAGLTESIMTMDRNSFWTDMSLFMLWGLFIGYSITFEFTDEQTRGDSSQQANPS